uniref:Uncharacterized protein n=1 Tax=Chromera velia CCMP2878 TaxID=1169474 RepID=A0A0G4IEZ5_9ALVE|eukprot:Cvel_13751.t1-p1 / transcript=Cvel_13751.t1 / gene=Cvel_13751 / organism=Chromera_velia_CCMP2878 / gene_product=hypothetical protein / transcript_product=hypothetical protein / location=Cvel_scaffold952:25017-25241(+) / protein_length=75 / sequence_SO=supercontig / SO=protein_coding / is_pseudo=false
MEGGAAVEGPGGNHGAAAVLKMAALESLTLQRFVAANLLSSIHSRRGTKGPFQPEGLLGREVAAFSGSFDREGAN